MITLDLTNAPRWHDLAPGVRVQLRPLTTAQMVATRSDPAVEAVPEEASDEERAVAFANGPVAGGDWLNTSGSVDRAGFAGACISSRGSSIMQNNILPRFG